MTINYRSPYDIPREAEKHASAFVVSTLRTSLEVVWFSLLPAMFFIAVGAGWSYLDQQAWMLQMDHVAVNGLAALSIGCVRISLRQDCQGVQIR